MKIVENNDTLKNLRHSHHLICPANNKQSESETVVEPCVPEKPKLVRSVAVEPRHEEIKSEEIKPKVKKTIKKVKVPKEPEVENPVFQKKSKAVLKTEKYEALVKNAL